MAQSRPGTLTTVLLVQREAVVRLELAGRLADMGLAVMEASNADEAIALLDAHPEIGVLLTDIRMTGSMDGIKLAHHVRERWPPVRIIVTSGLISTALSDLPPGAIFVSKPYRPEAISSAVAFMVGRRPRPADPRPARHA